MNYKLVAMPAARLTRERFEEGLNQAMTSRLETPLFLSLLQLGYSKCEPFAYGSSCYVCQARDHSGKPVVIKLRHFPDPKKLEESNDPLASIIRALINPEDYREGIRKKALAEYTAMALRDNPFVVPPVDCFFRDNYVGFVYPMIEGPSLDNILSFSFRDSYVYGLPQPIVRNICAELVYALSVMHRAGYVYRNLNAQHILFESDGHIKLIGFGAAKKIVANDALTRTSSYEAVGGDSPAPEILENARNNFGLYEYGYSVDAWSLGIIAYRLLTGLLPEETDFDRRLNEFSVETQQFISALLSDTRLQYDAVGVEALKQHPWFQSIDWELMAQRTEPKVLPTALFLGGMRMCEFQRSAQQRDLMGLQIFSRCGVPYAARRGPHGDMLSKFGHTLFEFNPE